MTRTRPLAVSGLALVLLAAAACETTDGAVRDDDALAAVQDRGPPPVDVDVEDAPLQMNIGPLRERDPSPEAYRALLTAELKQLEGDVPGAIDAVREAIVHDPSSVFLRVRLGQLNLSVGDLERALKSAQRALELDPDNIEALRLYAGAANLSGEREQAMGTLEHALKVAPGDRPASTLLAELLIEDDDLPRAEGVIEALMKAEPGATDGYLVLARLFKGRGETERALAYIERALERDGRSPEALEMKIDLLHARGDYAAAMPTVQALIRERGDSRNTRYRLLVGHLLADEREVANELAAAFLDEDDSADMLLLISDAQETAGATDLALALLERQQKTGALRDDRLAVRMARLLMASGDAERASDVVCSHTPSAQEEGWFSYVRVLCARAQLKAGHPDEAKQVLEATMARLPHHWRALSALSQVALEAPEVVAVDDALAAIADARKARPLDVDLVDVQVRALEQHHREPQAREVMAEVLKARPRHPELLMVQARHLERTGNPLGAVAVVERLMERSTRPQTDHLNFAAFTLAEEHRRLDDALTWAWRAVLREPLNGYIIDTLGWTQLQHACAGRSSCDAERLGEAVATLRRADRLSPGEAEVLFHLATALKMAGEPEDALKLAERALGLVDHQGTLKPRIEQLVEQLKAAA